MKLVWTGEALERLHEIEVFISRNNPERAEKFIAYLIDQAELLTDNPDLGRVVPEFSNDLIRELIVNKYRIVYRKAKERIKILTVFEGHQLLKEDDGLQ